MTVLDLLTHNRICFTYCCQRRRNQAEADALVEAETKAAAKAKSAEEKAARKAKEKAKKAQQEAILERQRRMNADSVTPWLAGAQQTTE